MSRRDQIQMSADELRAFVAEQRVVTCATIGPGGRPHLMPLWFCVLDGEVAAWTYGKSQKITNLERRAEATLQLEAGDSYDQLRGAMLECDVELRRDLDAVTRVGRAVLERYAPGGAQIPEDAVMAQAPKRVAMVFRPTRTVTWDHRKLGGTY